MTDYVNLIKNCSFKARPLTEDEINRIKLEYNSDTHSDIVKFSKKKKILPFIAKMFCKLSLDEVYWSDIIETYRRRNSYILDIVKSVFDKFEEFNIKKILVYENFGALLASESDISQFSSGDVDLYADIEERQKIEEALSELGFYIKNIGQRDFVSSVYYCDELKEKFHITIMWQALSRDKLPFELDIDNCLDWDHIERYKATSIKLPSPTTLMYLCMLHVSVHGYSREPDLRLYKDIENLSKLNIEWEELYKYAEHDSKQVRIITVAYISNSLIGTSIPNWLIKEKENFENRVNKILSVVYDEENETLIYNPTGLNLLKIEVLSDFNTFFGGIFNILFPDRNWIKRYYLKERDSLFKGYLLHIKNIM